MNIGVGSAVSQDVRQITVGTGGRCFEHQGQLFVPCGANYDHDRTGRLLEDYWIEEWETVEEDMQELKQLGANVVRIHLQFGKFMLDPERVNVAQKEQLIRLLKLAEEIGVWLDITGLGCYHKSETPEWYDALDRQQRWEAQANFWTQVATCGRGSKAIFCYDLMNEPILPGRTPESDWLAPERFGKTFVQRIALDLEGLTREEMAQQWLQKLTSAIRQVDSEHLITVGVIPWAQVFPGAKPIFYSPECLPWLDFVSVHVYPKQDEVEKTLLALKVYDLGKPLVVEEIFPLQCSLNEVEHFIKSAVVVDGWISFYWGETIDECRQQSDLPHQITAQWLESFYPLVKSLDFASRCTESD